MKVSSFGHKFDKLEQILHSPVEPSSSNQYRFQTDDGKSVKKTKVLEDFEALAKVMEKKHEILDFDEKQAIWRVLRTIRHLSSDKINNRYVIFSEQSHPVLKKRIDQIDSLLERLGVTHQSALSQTDHQKLRSQTSHLHTVEVKSLPRDAR